MLYDVDMPNQHTLDAFKMLQSSDPAKERDLMALESGINPYFDRTSKFPSFVRFLSNCDIEALATQLAPKLPGGHMSYARPLGAFLFVSSAQPGLWFKVDGLRQAITDVLGEKGVNAFQVGISAGINLGLVECEGSKKAPSILLGRRIRATSEGLGYFRGSDSASTNTKDITSNSAR